MSDNEKELIKLTETETDVIGEVMNISMGAAATAMSTILDKKVSITTPRIDTMKIEEFEFTNLEPVLGVLIRYIEGIVGSNMLLLKEEDLKKILCHLLSVEADEIAEFDEISISAICEIMNQMMGSASSALASFLGVPVNISPPEILDTTSPGKVRDLFSITGDSLVSIRFNLNIEGLVESEFISAMDPKLVKAIVEMSFGAGNLEQEPAPSPASAPAPAEKSFSDPTPEMPSSASPIEPTFEAPASAPPAAPVPAYNPPPQYSEPARPMQQPVPQQGSAIEHYPSPQTQAIPYTYNQLAPDNNGLSMNDSNLDLIMSVPIQITVELGKARKKIKDIADLTLGNIIELDRQAGDQVDIVANGKLIARGDVVVVDDYFSVRITEIMKATKEGFTEYK